MSALTVARIGAVVWLTIVWCAVMESISLGTVVAGAVVAIALTLLFPSRSGTLSGVRFRPLAFLAMNLGLFGDLVRANIQVAWAVIAPRRAGLRPGIVLVPLVPCTELVLQLLLNAVSLTPGTLIVEVRREPLVLAIHVLQLHTEAGVHLEVLRVQRRIVAALGPRATLDAVDARIEALRAVAEHGGPVPDLTEEVS